MDAPTHSGDHSPPDHPPRGAVTRPGVKHPSIFCRLCRGDLDLYGLTVLELVEHIVEHAEAFAEEA
jgi:hypothetical protein